MKLLKKIIVFHNWLKILNYHDKVILAGAIEFLSEKVTFSFINLRSKVKTLNELLSRNFLRESQKIILATDPLPVQKYGQKKNLKLNIQRNLQTFLES